MDRDHDDQIDLGDFERGITRLGVMGTTTKEDLKKIFSQMTVGNGVTATVRTFTK